MKKLCILVIADIKSNSNNKFLINNLWYDQIESIKNNPNVDIFLLYERDFNVEDLPKIKSTNYIIDQNTDYNNLIPTYLYDLNGNTNIPTNDKKSYAYAIPRILSKTIYALSILQNKYDIFLRTNITTILHIPNIISYINNNNIIYSGPRCYDNILRKFLYLKHYSIEDFKLYKSNTFMGGVFIFINNNEVNHILKNKHLIRYDQADDLAIGLMMKNYNKIPFEMFYPFRGSNIDSNNIENINYYKNILDKLDYNSILSLAIKHYPHDKSNIVKELYNLIKNNYLKI